MLKMPPMLEKQKNAENCFANKLSGKRETSAKQNKRILLLLLLFGTFCQKLKIRAYLRKIDSSS